MKLNIYGPNLRDQSKGTFVVHAADCKDCGKLRGENRYSNEFGTIQEAARAMYSDQINEGPTTIEDAVQDMHFAPCVTIPLK